MTDLRKHLDALHEAATPGPWTQEPCMDWEFVDRTVMELGDRHRFGVDLASTDAELVVALVNAWPEISRQLAAVEAIIPVLDRARENGTVLTYGAVQNMIRKALDGEQ